MRSWNSLRLVLVMKAKLVSVASGTCMAVETLV